MSDQMGRIGEEVSGGAPVLVQEWLSQAVRRRELFNILSWLWRVSWQLAFLFFPIRDIKYFSFMLLFIAEAVMVASRQEIISFCILHFS